jgi:DNA-binding transcriptional regulator YiaG
MPKETEQAKKIRAAKETLQVTTEELAALLGVEVATLNAWLRPEASKAHRPMPEMARRLLAYILRDHREGRRPPKA